MPKKRYHLYKETDQDEHLYLEVNDLSEAAVQIWQGESGEKKTFIRIKMTGVEWEKIMNEYKNIKVSKKDRGSI